MEEVFKYYYQWSCHQILVLSGVIKMANYRRQVATGDDTITCRDKKVAESNKSSPELNSATRLEPVLCC